MEQIMTGVSAQKSFTAQSQFLGGNGRPVSRNAATGSLMIRWASAQTGWPHDVCDGGRGRSGNETTRQSQCLLVLAEREGQDDTRQ